MLEIMERQKLELENLFCFRAKVKQTEVDSIVKDMDDKLMQARTTRIGNPVTATFGVDGEYIDIEIMLPIDKKIGDIGRYYYKEKLEIVNAVLASYKGHPGKVQEVCNLLNKYIVDNKLQPITVGYNITKMIDPLHIENTQIDIYVGINPNIL